MSYTDHILKEDGWFTGEDKIIVFRVYSATATQPAIEAESAPTETITGWSLSYMVKRSRTDPDSEAVITRTTTAGQISIISPDAFVTITKAITENLEEAVYYHELKRVDSGLNHVLCDGIAHIRRALHN